MPYNESPAPYSSIYLGGSPSFQNQTGDSMSSMFMSSMPYDLIPGSNMGNRSFVPLSGFNSNNMMLNLVASMGAQSLTGSRMISPIQGYNATDYSFMQGLGRTQLSLQARNQLLSSAPGLSNFGSMGSQPAFQMAYGMLEGGGGNRMAALEQAFAGLGPAWGGSLTHQASMAQQAVNTIGSAFTGEDGTYDYKKSFGFDTGETIRNLQTVRRSGFAGVNLDAKSLATTAKNVNEYSRIAQNTFPGESAESANALMEKAAGSFAGITPEKASQFAARLQSTSRALDINSKAFAEYMAVQQKVYESVGVGGAAAAETILNNAAKAQSAANTARARGDIHGTNVQENLSRQNFMTENFMNSDLMLKVGAMLTHAGTNTPEGKKVTERINASLRSGNVDEIRKTFLALAPEAYKSAQEQFGSERYFAGTPGAKGLLRTQNGDYANSGNVNGGFPALRETNAQIQREILTSGKSGIFNQIDNALSKSTNANIKSVYDLMPQLGVDTVRDKGKLKKALAAAGVNFDARTINEISNTLSVGEFNAQEITGKDPTQFEHELSHQGGSAGVAQQIDAYTKQALALNKEMGNISRDRTSVGSLVDTAGRINAEAEKSKTFKERYNDMITGATKSGTNFPDLVSKPPSLTDRYIGAAKKVLGKELGGDLEQAVAAMNGTDGTDKNKVDTGLDPTMKELVVVLRNLATILSGTLVAAKK